MTELIYLALFSAFFGITLVQFFVQSNWAMVTLSAGLWCGIMFIASRT